MLSAHGRAWVASSVVAFVVAVAGSAALAQQTGGASDFIRANPEIVGLALAGMAMFITALASTLGYFLKRTLDAGEVADRGLRASISAVSAELAKVARDTDEKIDALTRTMMEQWERFHGEMQAQGKALATLQGEHAVMARHHFGGMRRADDRAETIENGENEGGD